MRYGYVRVSTKEQNIDRQMSALSIENIPQHQIFNDKSKILKLTSTANPSGS